MKALVFHHPKKVKVEEVKDPNIEDDKDIIVKVTSTAICGSDLHIYNGFIPQAKDMVLGHEFMGIVEETGKGIKHLKKGDRVVVPFPIACGSCFFCKHALPTHCETSNDNYGPEGGMLKEKGGALFGYTDLYGGYQGGQAEYVRVPYAHFGPRKIEDNLRDEEVLFLSDIFPTGWSAIDWAELKGDETVAVFGCGPVGIMAQKAAWLKGAKRVIGIDPLNYRLEIARKSAKSETINPYETNVVEFLREITEGRGPDVCVDAVGMEVDRNFGEKISNTLHGQAGSIKVIDLAASAVRRGGIISIVGVYGSPYDNFPFGQIFDKGIALKTGQAPVQHYIDELLNLVRSNKVTLDDIITHVLPLEQAEKAYEIFCKKEDNCLKVILKP
ncbi:zinc-dependent alcohol dehydrogenase [Criblamydia sequanensis]|uniref:Alcohol dehydrogenase n=1 Tax=Candidatus Criblamydia sequanensis CRIB-18 TaxID=1437425 RepID=A0A090D0U4_9BACT|nr:zinc-dependent alcohol dehydrogenase [Criblamydia sequanensis]CDR34966.1 Alcohol dehydrogenase [Criblamydia sequanensis CRIB-18]